MKLKTTTPFAMFIFLIVNTFTISAQENTITTGGESTGTNGSVSYTIGQPFYTEVADQDNYLIEGVQQPYEVSIISGVENNTVNLSITAFPNPTTNYFTLESENWSDNATFYTVSNISGVLIQRGEIENKTTQIDISTLPNSTYFVTIKDSKTVLKTFQVIKH